MSVPPPRSGVSPRAPAGRVRVGVLLAAVAGGWVGAPAAADAATLARGGEAAVAIVVGADPSLQERTAAQELADYLTRISGASFAVESEGSRNDERPAIHVGRTAFAGARGIDGSSLAPEEWVIETAGDDLILCGGRPRGTLYAVYRFLEDRLGVRWWTPFEERVPERKTLRIGRIQARGRPAFEYRDITGIDGPRAFCARNRINGHYTRLPWMLGGMESYGPPSPVHNLYDYVPPERYFPRHPEFFSEVDGVRVAERAQLCLTDAGLRELVGARLRGYIEQARAAAERRGEAPPRLFDISQEDWGRPCECDRCQAIAAREGSEAGPLLDFINAIAAAIEPDYPDVLLGTLAYHYTFLPPRSLGPRDNVVIRLAGLQRRDYSKSVIHRDNTVYREAVLAWAELAGKLRIWDYSATFADYGELPLPNLRYFQTDYRFYRDAGVEGMFIQLDFPIRTDMHDMKLWVTAKLLEEPDRGYEALVKDFTDGFYGRAGPYVRRYLRLLDRAAEKNPSRIRYGCDLSAFEYLDAAFLRTADTIFRRAEAAVAGQPVLLRRVNHARMALDRAIVLMHDKLAGAAEAGSRRTPPDREQVIERYARTWREQIVLRVPEDRRVAALRRVDEEVLLLRAGAYED